MFELENIQSDEKKEIDSYVWAKKYAPQTIDDYIGSEDLKNSIKKYIQEQKMPNILFHGNAGTGKTTLSKIIANSINCDYSYVNASDENSVDFVRSYIKNFSTTRSSKKNKILILDECLHEDTLVLINRKGKTAYEKIKNLNEKFDYVRSYDFKRKTYEWSEFKLIDKGTSKKCVEIFFENDESVICTLDHKWHAPSTENINRIVMTKDLKAGDVISNADGYLKIKKIEDRSENSYRVYDLSVEPNNNFLITNKNILTHNCDRMSAQAQDALKVIIDESICNYILICNNISLIRDPILSRMVVFHVSDMDKAAIENRMEYILKKEKISYKIEDLKKVIENFYPDIRKTINFIQKSSIDGIFRVSKTNELNYDRFYEIIEILNSKIPDHEKFFKVKNFIKSDKSVAYASLYDLFYKNLDKIEESKILSLASLIHKYQYESYFVPDKEVSFMAFISDLIRMMK